MSQALGINAGDFMVCVDPFYAEGATEQPVLRGVYRCAESSRSFCRVMTPQLERGSCWFSKERFKPVWALLTIGG